jgi:hypothetical protein
MVQISRRPVAMEARIHLGFVANLVALIQVLLKELGFSNISLLLGNNAYIFTDAV